MNPFDDDTHDLFIEVALELVRLARTLGAEQLSVYLPAADGELVLLTWERMGVWLTVRGAELCLLRLGAPPEI